MILHSEAEWIFPQPNLLHDAIVSAPSFCFQIVAQPFDRLVMGAVDFAKTMRRAVRAAQWLNVAMTLFGQIVPFDVEL